MHTHKFDMHIHVPRITAVVERGAHNINASSTSAAVMTLASSLLHIECYMYSIHIYVAYIYMLGKLDVFIYVCNVYVYAIYNITCLNICTYAYI